MLLCLSAAAQNGIPWDELEPAQTENTILKTDNTGTFDTIGLEGLKAVLDYAIFDTFYNDGKDQLIIEVSTSAGTEKYIVDILDLGPQNIYASYVPHPTYVRWSIWLDNSDTIRIDDVFYDPAALKYTDTVGWDTDVSDDFSGSYLDLTDAPNSVDINYWFKNVSNLGYTSGNVGVGTLNPTEKLHVYNGDLQVEQSSNNSAVFRFVNSVNEWAMSNNLNGDYILRPRTVDADFSIKSLDNTEYFKVSSLGNVAIHTLSGSGTGLVEVANNGRLFHLDYSAWDIDASDDFSGIYDDLTGLPTLDDLNYWTLTGSGLSYDAGDIEIEGLTMNDATFETDLDGYQHLVKDISTGEVFTSKVFTTAAYKDAGQFSSGGAVTIDWDTEIYDNQNTTESAGVITTSGGYYDLSLTLKDFSYEIGTTDEITIRIYNGGTIEATYNYVGKPNVITLAHTLLISASTKITVAYGLHSFSFDEAILSLTQKTASF